MVGIMFFLTFYILVISLFWNNIYSLGVVFVSYTLDNTDRE